MLASQLSSSISSVVVIYNKQRKENEKTGIELKRIQYIRKNTSKNTFVNKQQEQQGTGHSKLRLVECAEAVAACHANIRRLRSALAAVESQPHPKT